MKKNSKQQIVQYDPESDVLYLGARKGFEEEYVEVAPGVGVELDEDGKVIGIEILNASKVMKPVSRLMFSGRRIPQRSLVSMQ